MIKTHFILSLIFIVVSFFLLLIWQRICQNFKSLIKINKLSKLFRCLSCVAIRFSRGQFFTAFLCSLRFWKESPKLWKLRIGSIQVTCIEIIISLFNYQFPIMKKYIFIFYLYFYLYYIYECYSSECFLNWKQIFQQYILIFHISN